MQSSLYLLYKRGKYSRQIAPPDAALSSQPQEQRERYAVTAIAFCLKHDKYFRDAFCDRVLKRPLNDPIIRVEPFLWADLMIETEKEIFVVEFKISAGVQNHQQPGNSKGYVRKIQDYATSKKKEDTYIVLGGDCEHHTKPNCVAMGWDRLAEINPESSLISDLFDCLGRLGVRELSGYFMRFTTNAALAQYSQAAAKIHRLLADFIESEQLTSSTTELSNADEESWFIGYNMCISRKRRSVATDLLIKMTRSKEILGWVGYEGNLERTTLSFWFYCDSREIAEDLYQILSDIRRPNEEAVLASGEDNRNVALKRQAAASGGDREWFHSVLERLKAPPTKRRSTPLRAGSRNTRAKHWNQR